jgi:DNA-directed RNA polymerase III subunit RPC6
MLWDASPQDVDDGSDHPNSKRKRKHRSGDDHVRSTKRKCKKKNRNSSSEESSSDEDESDRKPRQKRSKMDSVGDEPPDSDTGKPKRKKGSTALFADDSSSDGRELQRTKQGKKKSKRRHTSSSDEDSPSYDSDASRGIHNKAMKRSPSPIHALLFGETDDGTDHVYRAVREERIPVGWTEAPCCLCPSFYFCKEGGPVNPQECTYYGDWLTGGSAVAIEDGI